MERDGREGEIWNREEKKKRGSGRNYRGRGFTGSRFCFPTLRFYVIIYAVRCGSFSTLRAIVSLVVVCTLEVLLYISVDRAAKPYHIYYYADVQEVSTCVEGYRPAVHRVCCVGVSSRVSGISPECSIMTYRFAIHVTMLHTFERPTVVALIGRSGPFQ